MRAAPTAPGGSRPTSRAANAPIAFFAYNRPLHARRALESLEAAHGARESALYVFSDAARKPEDEEAVARVRAVARERAWCGEVRVVEREKNMGCARSIIDGVTRLCGRFGRVVVVEDDLILAPHFLEYMNAALDRYRDEPRVVQVSGHMFPAGLAADADAVFLPFTTSWGWGTWERAWKRMDPGMAGFERLAGSPLLRYRFDIYGSYPFFEILCAAREGRVDSWAMPWYLGTFLAGGLTLHPVESLVRNIGLDGSGTHCEVRSDGWAATLGRGAPARFPARVREDRRALRAMAGHFRTIHGRQAPGPRPAKRILSDLACRILLRGGG